MLSLKHLVAALAVGAAMVVAPGAASVALAGDVPQAISMPHHATTLVSVKHPKHKRKHRPLHKKHPHKKVAAHTKLKPVALHGKTTAKPLAARAGGRHSDI